MITTFQRSLYKSAGYTWPEIAGFLIYTTTITYLYMEMDFSFLAMSPVPVTITSQASLLKGTRRYFEAMSPENDPA